MNNQQNSPQRSRGRGDNICCLRVQEQKQNDSPVKPSCDYHHRNSKIGFVSSPDKSDGNLTVCSFISRQKREKLVHKDIESPLRPLKVAYIENLSKTDSLLFQRKQSQNLGFFEQTSSVTEYDKTYIESLEENVRRYQELSILQSSEIQKLKNMVVNLDTQNRKLVKFEALYMQLQNRPPFLSKSYQQYLRQSHNQEVNTIDLSTLRVEKSIELLLKKLQYVEVVVGSIERGTEAASKKFKDHKILSQFDDLKQKIKELQRISQGGAGYSHEARSNSCLTTHPSNFKLLPTQDTLNIEY